MKITTVGVLILALHTISCAALRCYVCTYDSTTNQDPMCEGPVVDASLLQECPSESTSCSKTSATLSGLVTSVSRGCSEVGTFTCESDSITSRCYCSSDGCNSSNTVAVATSLLPVSLFLAIFAVLFV